MSQLRQDPLTGVWAVVAPSRGERPKDFPHADPSSGDASTCPLCGGREGMTPPTKFLGGLPGANGWATRVVDNKFPTFSAPDDEFGPRDLPAPAPYKAVTAFGGNEVIVETPRHGEGLADLSEEHGRLLVDTYMDRLRFWREDGRVAYTFIFRNWGSSAGASLSHAHSQLAALPRVPDHIVREMGNVMTYHQRERSCLLCDMMRGDDAGGRTLLDDGLTRVVAPFASPVPYALRIAPVRCHASVLDSTEEERASFARSLLAVARGLRDALGDPPWNFFLHIAPYRMPPLEGAGFHWHADVIPRSSDLAGFEMGSGQYVNSVDPDDAAAVLREAMSEL